MANTEEKDVHGRRAVSLKRSGSKVTLTAGKLSMTIDPTRPKFSGKLKTSFLFPHPAVGPLSSTSLELELDYPTRNAKASCNFVLSCAKGLAPAMGKRYGSSTENTVRAICSKAVSWGVIPKVKDSKKKTLYWYKSGSKWYSTTKWKSSRYYLDSLASGSITGGIGKKYMNRYGHGAGETHWALGMGLRIYSTDFKYSGITLSGGVDTQLIVNSNRWGVAAGFYGHLSYKVKVSSPIPGLPSFNEQGVIYLDRLSSTPPQRYYANHCRNSWEYWQMDSPATTSRRTYMVMPPWTSYMGTQCCRC